MAIHDLKEQIARLPEQPGVYLYFNAPARRSTSARRASLRDRVRSYLGARGTSPKTDALLDEALGLEVIVTDSVVEALALENNLIKQRSPKYNILLRDDKNYPYLQLTTSEAVPARAGGAPRRARRRLLRRAVPAGQARPADDGADAPAVRHPVVQRGDHGERGRPCLEYDIKRCLAPCVAADLLARALRQAVATRGCSSRAATTNCRRPASADGEAADDERFEQAAQLRDAIRTVRRCATASRRWRRRAGRPRRLRREGRAGGAVVQVFQVRAGRVVERVDLSRPGAPGPPGAGATPTCSRRPPAVLRDREPPPEVHVPVEPARGRAARGWLSARRPPRAARRAAAGREARPARAGAATPRWPTSALQRRRPRTTTRSRRCARARPARLPRRIECFDISTIQGSETVASMVVCEDGRMKPSASTGSSAISRGTASAPRPIPRRLRRDGAGGAAAVRHGRGRRGRGPT
jgi:excinuclease ABC subunit C